MRRAASLPEAMAANRSTDFYATLGVARNAKPDAIRKAYRHLARKYHPDVNPGDTVSETRFKEVQEAYGVLSDKRKREFYDQYGFYSDQAFAEGTGAPGAGRRPGGFGFDGFDFTDFGRRAGAGPGADFGSLFETFLGGGRRPKPATAEKHPGEDLEYTMDIDFHDAIEGTTARLNIARYSSCAACSGSGSAQGARPRDCRECGGSGQLHKAAGNMRFSVPCATCRGEGKIHSLCSACGGDGRVSSNVPIEVRIPPGTQENSRLRIPGKGNAGLRGGPSGDLYIVARVGTHPFFERKGYDIHIQVPVSPAEAILGAKIEVPTIDGTAFLRVPPATNSGKTFRVRERGVRRPRSGKRGDQFVRITIVVPEIPDETTKELMRRYAERNPDNPTRGDPAAALTMAKRQKTKGSYTISVVAERFDVHPQTLRLYEREGLLLPSRTEGNTRLYTDEDIERLDVILSLTRDLGVNLAGVEIILNMRNKMDAMQRQVREFVKYVNSSMSWAEDEDGDEPFSNALIPVKTRLPMRARAERGKGSDPGEPETR